MLSEMIGWVVDGFAFSFHVALWSLGFALAMGLVAAVGWAVGWAWEKFT